MSSEADFREALRETLVEREGPCELVSVERRGAGWSWETFLVEARCGEATRNYAVKREPIGGINPADYDVEKECALLDVVGDSLGLPVPEAIACRPPNGAERGFYVMEKVPGTVPMAWNVDKVLPEAGDRERIALEIAGTMARLHQADTAAMELPALKRPSDPAAVGREEMLHWKRIYREVSPLRLPVIDLAFAWLDACSDWVSGRLALVHRDLRIGNFIVDDGRLATVLDWETAEFTDPTSDLARFNLPNFRGRSPLASLLIEFDRFADEYERLTGWRPSEKGLRYWTVLEMMNIIVGSIRAGGLFADGESRDVRYATMTYQTHHHIRALVRLYEEGAWGTLR